MFPRRASSDMRANAVSPPAVAGAAENARGRGRKGAGRRMSDVFDWLAGVVSTQGVDIILGLVVTAIGFYFNQTILTQESRERLVEALEMRSPLDRYRLVLRRALDWIDVQLARDPAATRAAIAAGATRGGPPFSTRLFELSLTLALLYPAVLILGLWALGVGEGRVGGDFVILEADADEGQRLMALLALIVTLILTLAARAQRRRPAREWREFGWLVVAVLVVSTGVFAIVEANAAETTSGRRELLSTAVITSLGVAVTVAAAGALRGATALAVAVGVTIASVLVWDSYQTVADGGGEDSVALLVGEISRRLGLGAGFFDDLGVAPIAAVAVILTALFLYAAFAPSVRKGRVVWSKGAVLRAFAFMLGGSVGAVLGVKALDGVVDYGVAAGFGLALFILILAAQAFSGVVRAISDRVDLPGFSFALFAAYLAAAGLVFAVAAQAPAVDVNLRIYLVMFAFLPALNVAFDFMTAGATRFFLRQGVTSDGRSLPLLWTFVDLVIAFALFLLLGFAMVAAGAYFRMTADQPVFDAVAVVQDIRADVGAYTWLLIAMFSTLAPTLAHLSIAIFSLVLLLWNQISARIARLVRRGGEDGGARAIAVIIITAFFIASVVVPVLLLVLLVAYVGPQAQEAGGVYLNLLESFAERFSRLLGGA